MVRDKIIDFCLFLDPVPVPDGVPDYNQGQQAMAGYLALAIAGTSLGCVAALYLNRARRRFFRTCANWWRQISCRRHLPPSPSLSDDQESPGSSDESSGFTSSSPMHTSSSSPHCNGRCRCSCEEGSTSTV